MSDHYRCAVVVANDRDPDDNEVVDSERIPMRVGEHVLFAFVTRYRGRAKAVEVVARVRKYP